MAKIIQCVFQRRRVGLGVEGPPDSSALLPCWGLKSEDSAQILASL